MANYDGGWRPDVGMETYNGYEVGDHGVSAHELTEGQIEGEVAFDWEALGDGVSGPK